MTSAVAMFETIEAILHWQEMSTDIVDALGSGGQRDFDSFVARVEGRFENSRNFAAVVQFTQDHSRLRDDELVRLFEFIYSSMVNNFKGELAELFARPRLADFAAMQPHRDLEIVLGPRLRARQAGSRNGWYKGADAILCRRRRGRLEIAAVAEIKAMDRPVPPLLHQVARHVHRMRRGLTIDDLEIAPESIDIQISTGETMPLLSIGNSIDEVTALLIRPWIASEDGAIIRDDERRNVWLAELRYKQDEITEAAYRFTAWYFSRIGPKVFCRPADAPANRGRLRPAPYPEDSLEENGLNSFIAALYGAWNRKVFQPRRPDEPRGGKRTPGDTLLWLYNSMTGGYEQATTDDLFFPAFEPDVGYQARIEQRNRAVDLFLAGQIVEALRLLPDPVTQKDVWNRRREWLMLARICVLAGKRREASDALEAAKREPPSANHGVPFEIAAVEALLTGDDEAIRRASDLLDGLRREVHEHEQNGWAFPADLDARSVQAGVIDLSIALASRHDLERATSLLRKLAAVDRNDLRRIESDPALASIVAGLDRVAMLEPRGLARF